MSEMLTLENLSREVRPVEQQEETFELDFTFLYPKREEAGERVFYTYKKLKAALLFGGELRRIVELIKKQRPFMEDSLAFEMAFMIASHVEPVCENKGMIVPIYCQYFDTMTEGEKLLIVNEFTEKSGREFITQMQTMIEERKKNSETPSPPKTEPDGNSSDSVSDTEKPTPESQQD
jgi:hypothetical protein